MSKLINKGTGAGGAKTNEKGKGFENETSIEEYLFKDKYEKGWFNTNSPHGYYLRKNKEDTSITYFKQGGLKHYFMKEYNIELCRNPDEAYIIKTKDTTTVKILEKKEQHREGSVETKLWAGPSLKREFELILGDKFKVEYAFCLSKFLFDKMTSKTKKYVILSQIFKENNIDIFYGNDPDYYNKLMDWIKKI